MKNKMICLSVFMLCLMLFGCNKKIKEEIQLDPEKTYYVCFVNKTRNDEGDRQILYEWKGAWNRWYEIGYCNIINDHRSIG